MWAWIRNALLKALKALLESLANESPTSVKREAP